MKKFLALILVFTLVFSLTACGGKTDDNDKDPIDVPGVTEPEVTEPDVTEPAVEDPDVVEPDTTEPDIVEPDEVDPNLPGLGEVVVPGFGEQDNNDDTDNSVDVEVTPVTEEMINKLIEITEGKTGDMFVDYLGLESLDVGMFSNWFNGLPYAEGTKVAVNVPMMGSIAHVALLIEPAEGVSAEDYAAELLANANPRWQICVEANDVRAEVKDGVILFMMTNTEIVDADSIVEAFNA